MYQSQVLPQGRWPTGAALPASIKRPWADYHPNRVNDQVDVDDVFAPRMISRHPNVGQTHRYVRNLSGPTRTMQSSPRMDFIQAPIQTSEAEMRQIEMRILEIRQFEMPHIEMRKVQMRHLEMPQVQMSQFQKPQIEMKTIKPSPSTEFLKIDDLDDCMEACAKYDVGVKEGQTKEQLLEMIGKIRSRPSKEEAENASLD
ncbi:hypothetical protein K504DRAFT_500756 [Pleomassaria siparia CBS 279.74]|uniref:Uncharacterized protein n=1 Tax=Pleomassaria siparia CBS 279.74 TaxID=1314801 RepID=A0A6G1KEE9_9PLEO|nr:hypothetical protein K504DRAFT_500756 [Pleomassaria siparia CBS 279.74]